MSRLSYRPSDPAYHIEDCQILNVAWLTRTNRAEIYCNKFAIEGAFTPLQQYFRGVNSNINYCATSEKIEVPSSQRNLVLNDSSCLWYHSEPS